VSTWWGKGWQAGLVGWLAGSLERMCWQPGNCQARHSLLTSGPTGQPAFLPACRPAHAAAAREAGRTPAGGCWQSRRGEHLHVPLRLQPDAHQGGLGWAVCIAWRAKRAGAQACRATNSLFRLRLRLRLRPSCPCSVCGWVGLLMAMGGHLAPCPLRCSITCLLSLLCLLHCCVCCTRCAHPDMP